MTMAQIAETIDARVLLGNGSLDREVDSACGSDLMSDVLAFVKGKTALITGLTNVHVVRTAEMLDIRCIVFTRGKTPEADVLAEAEACGITVLATQHTTYTACGLLYAAGLRGTNDCAASAR